MHEGCSMIFFILSLHNNTTITTKNNKSVEEERDNIPIAIKPEVV